MNEQCPKLNTVLSDYMDGTLPPEQHKEIERHIEQCTYCSKYLHHARRTEQNIAQSNQGDSKRQFLEKACGHFEQLIVNTPVELEGRAQWKANASGNQAVIDNHFKLGGDAVVELNSGLAQRQRPIPNFGPPVASQDVKRVDVASQDKHNLTKTQAELPGKASIQGETKEHFLKIDVENIAEEFSKRLGHVEPGAEDFIWHFTLEQPRERIISIKAGKNMAAPWFALQLRGRTWGEITDRLDNLMPGLLEIIRRELE